MCISFDYDSASQFWMFITQEHIISPSSSSGFSSKCIWTNRAQASIYIFPFEQVIIKIMNHIEDDSPTPHEYTRIQARAL